MDVIVTRSKKASCVFIREFLQNPPGFQSSYQYRSSKLSIREVETVIVQDFYHSQVGSAHNYCYNRFQLSPSVSSVSNQLPI